MRSRRALTLLVCAGVLVTSGCTAGGASGGAAAAGSTEPVLRAAYQADMQTFDPDNGFEVAGLGAIRAVYEGLVDYEPGTTEVVGRLAEDFEVSDDGLTYTFTLREGVTFHDGSPLTAEAVQASFERRTTPEMALSYFLANVASMEAPDERTFVITLSSPQPSFLDNLASPWGPKVVSPEGLQKVEADPDWLNENASGTGPFRLAAFDRGQRYVLERFDEYWGEAAPMERVEIAIVPDVGQQVLQLRSGELDVVLHGYPYQQLADLPEGLAIEGYDDLGQQLAFVNPQRNLTTPEQRRRVAAAINPEGWLSDAFGEYAAPSLSLFPRAMLEPEDPYTWPSPEEAGTAEVPALEVVYTAEEAAVQQRVADLIVAQLDEAGIEATARSVPGTQIAGFIADPANAPDIYLAQNNPDSAHPDSQASLFYATGAPLNVFSYSNPAADEAFAEAATMTDVEERDAAYAEGGRLIFEDGGFLPLADVKDVIVHREGLTDLNPRPAVPWNLDFGTVRWED